MAIGRSGDGDAMELYYSPFACSLAPHIVCREARLPVVLRRVDLATQRVEGGADYLQVNALAQVPTLVLDDGQVLTENLAVLLWLGDQAPDSGLVPPARTPDHYQVLRWLSFVAAELHKNVLYRLFSRTAIDELKHHARASADRPLAVLERHLAGRSTLVGDHFTVADAHLIWALTISPFGGIALDPYPAVRAYCARHQQREAVATALDRERREYKQPLAIPA